MTKDMKSWGIREITYKFTASEIKDILQKHLETSSCGFTKPVYGSDKVECEVYESFYNEQTGHTTPAYVEITYHYKRPDSVESA